MAKILCIESATDVCSVAIAEDDKLLGIKEINEFKSHSEVITLYIDALLKDNNIDKSSIDAIAISDGPGSYTGLRIGASTAKGLAYAIDAPLIKISTLQALAAGIEEEISDDTLIFPMIDARRMEVYSACYDKDLKEITPVQSLILDQEEAKNLFKDKKVIFCGNGTKKCTEHFPASNSINYSKTMECSSKHMIKLAFDKYLNKDFADLAYYEPNYHKEWTGR